MRSLLFTSALFLCVTAIFVLFAKGANQTPSQTGSEILEKARPEKQQDSVILDELVHKVAYQESVDHFSDDARAMSPRSWGGEFQPGVSREPVAPQVTFGTGRPIESKPTQPMTAPNFPPGNSSMLQVESSRLRNPEPFFEQNQLLPGEFDASKLSSPLPMELDQKPTEKQLKQLQENAIPAPTSPNASQPTPTTGKTSEQNAAPNWQPVESVPPNFIPNPHPQSANFHSGINQCDPCQPLPADQGSCPSCRPLGKLFQRRNSAPRQQPGFCRDQCDNECMPAKFNQHLGHRYDFPATRGVMESSSSKFSFEEDGDFPPARQILAESVFWSEFEYMALQPSFQGNTAFTTSGPAAVSQPFNFELNSAFRVSAGFESDYGPGFAINYFQFDNDSEFANFTSDGVVSGTTSVYQLGPNVWTDLVADDLGEALRATHSLELHSTSVYAFKAIHFKRAYVNGRFGIQLTSIEQDTTALLTNAGGTVIGRLNQSSNIDAFGPRFGIDYVRKIGHTPAQLVSSATTSLLFGDRDQFVQNTATGEVSQIGADDFIAAFDIFFGVRGKRIRGEKRNTTYQVGFVNQTWFGGGTGIDPNGDFGFQGLSFMLGFNR